jgi:chromatin segregation and condensation protein Rec8/ScpA/Scc1 (kleisin family)
VASTFVAGLELAKQEVLGLKQQALFEELRFLAEGSGVEMCFV